MSLRRSIAALCISGIALSGIVALNPAAQPASAATPSATPGAGSYIAVSPTRLLDTRGGLGAARRPVPPRGAISVQFAGRGGVPATGISTVVLNVTVTQPKASGYLSVYGAATARPTVSNLNFGAGQTVANLVFAPVGAAGQVVFFNGSGATVQVLADVSGYFLAGTAINPGAYTAVSPTRVLDTRSGLGAHRSPVPGSGIATMPIAGRAGVPTSGVSAVVLNVTAARPVSSGYISVLQPGQFRPFGSNLNFSKAKTVPNLVVAPMGADGTVRFFNGSGSPTQLVADVSGYFLSGDTRGAGAFVPASGGRIRDSRDTRTHHQTIKPGQVFSVSMSSTSIGNDFLPNGVTPGVAGLLLNVTVVNPVAHGYVSVYAHGTRRPTVSSVNFATKQTIANSVVAPWGAGVVDFYNGSGGAIDIVVDIYGYFRSNREYDQFAPLPVRNLTISAVTSTTVTLKWIRYTPPDADLIGVVVRRAAGKIAPRTPTEGVLAGTAGAAALTFTDTGLTPGLPYAYAVFSVDDSGNYSGAGQETPAATTTLAWSASQQVDTTGGGLTSVSCVSAVFCMAVDDLGYAFSFNGTGWSAASDISFGALASVSCASESFCVAVDEDGFATSFDGSTWRSPVFLNSANAFTAVSCVSPAWCLAVDDGGSFFTYSAGTWSAPSVVAAGLDLEAVSCRSATSCVAGASTTQVVYYTAGVWGAPLRLEPFSGGGRASVSCPDDSLCEVVLGGIQYERINGIWSRPQGGGLIVSCASAEFCVRLPNGMGSATQRVVTQAEPGWARGGQLGITNVTGLSCPVAPFCMAVSANGKAVSST